MVFGGQIGFAKASRRLQPYPRRLREGFAKAPRAPPFGNDSSDSSTAVHRAIFYFFTTIRKIQHTVPPAASCQAERNFSALSALLGDLQSNLGRRKVEMMMLLKLNQ